ncbi:MAG: proline iminopeptidase-family hydrolase [Acidimicrobiia bacterium]|nr:proline iminopeptidase-family hydrolase [Acidimicrobiia bacterium]
MDGWIEVEDGYSVWYRIAGGGPGDPGRNRTPLLVLHGGPGCGYDYLEPLEALAAHRPVVFYDQLGSGRSDRPDDPGRWVIDRFVREIDLMRCALGLKRVHLLGHSWGGWLAIEYLTTCPAGPAAAGVERAVLASTSASLAAFEAETRRLRALLPAEARAALDEGDATGHVTSDAYNQAADQFYARHVCRLAEWPEPMLRTIANLEGNQSYEVMQGPNELVITGNLRTWDRTADLTRIDVPTLVTCGRHDEMGPPCAGALVEAIPAAELAVFEHSSHTAQLEEPEAYLATVAAFLRG